MEARYSFRKRLAQVHVPVRDPGIVPGKSDVIIDKSWEILVPENAGALLANVARDLGEYFKVALDLEIAVKSVKPGAADAVNRKIIIDTYAHFAEHGKKDRRPVRGCRIVCDRQNIYIVGADEKNAARGCYAVENKLNLRRAPCLKTGEWILENRFSPRMTHSGWGLDVFPDNYLNKIAHAGYDSILIYYRRSDASAERIVAINDLIRRAAGYGLGVYLYFNSYRYPVPEYDTMHPDETGAEQYYESFYGKAFENHPDAVGCILVPESCAFPTRDPDSRSDVLNMSGSKPHPLGWPCSDYPAFVRLVKKVVTKYRPDADVVFWTYGFGWAPEKKRIELIKHLPPGISLLLTFEMYETLNKIERCEDYTIRFTGPGHCFTGEADAAKAKKIRLYTMCNTGGRTWDFGVAPYVPVPFQWIRRWEAVLAAQRQWGISGLMESHHYGWQPSYISRLGEYYATSPQTDNPAKFLSDLAKNDFGAVAAKRLMKAWRLWSQAIKWLPANVRDQYGPLRVGPSYPFHFTETDAPNIPPDPDVMPQRSIVQPFYAPRNDPAGRRLVNHEIRSVKKLARIWQQGVAEIESGLPAALASGKAEYGRILVVGRFVNHTLRTLLNIKLWWQLRMKLKDESTPKTISRILDDMIAIANDEIKNAEETMPIVAEDSSLGWEPRMGYLTDKARLSWKIDQLKRVIRQKIPEYRRSAKRGTCRG